MKPVFFSPRGRGGMVLLELIIAMTIFALVSAGLVTALDRAFAVAADRRLADDATRGLGNQLALLKSQSLLPGLRDLPGDGSEIAYRVEVVPEPALDGLKQPILGLFRATLTARWKEGDATGSRSVSTLFYRP